MTPEQMVGDAFHYVVKPSDIDPVLDRLVSQHADFVKIMVLYSEEFEKRKDDPAYRGDKGLDPKLVPAIVAGAHKRGLKVAAHIETAADFRTIVAAGVDEAAHMPGYVALEDPVEKYRITDADALNAAKAHIVVVATASYGAYTRDAESRLPSVQDMQAANLKKLIRAGVPVLIGTDGKVDAAITECEYLVKLGVFDPATVLRVLSVDTPRYIFPKRKIGELAPTFEASFVAFKADPSSDVANWRSIDGYAKQGVLLKAPAAKQQ
jgi:imidazolonepropionase-like amidohydrolase